MRVVVVTVTAWLCLAVTAEDPLTARVASPPLGFGLKHKFLSEKAPSTSCACIPGYHDAHDVTCRIDSGGHLRVSHPKMVCAHERYRTHEGKCRLRVWTGTTDFHVCRRLSHTTCSCCDCINGKPHQCAAGTYRDVLSGACIACGAGSFSSAEKCVLCPAGKFGAAKQGTCDACTAGHYSSDPGQVHCIACAAGTYADAPGQVACVNCRAGRFQGSAAQAHCIDCAVGRHSSTGGATQCYVCDQGRWQPTAGSQACRLAARCVGSEFERHAPTSTSDRICGSDGTCDVSKYESAPAPSRECSACPPGSACDGVGATPCAIGRFSEGRAGEPHTTCEACSPGRYAPVAGHTSCFACPAGFYQQLTGSHGCDGCHPGRYGALAGMLQCRDCPSGQFSAMPQSTQCTVCPVGRGTANAGRSTCDIEL